MAARDEGSGLGAARVLDAEGELDHRDVFLSDEQRREGTTILTCVSRAVGGAITIDTGFRPERGADTPAQTSITR